MFDWLLNALPFWRRRAEQQAAQEEVLSLIRQHPVEGYGLYHLLDDAGLLSHVAKRDLKPLIQRIEKRMNLHPDDLQITLSPLFEPITDPEHDTLTALLGDALREFVHQLPGQTVDERFEALLSINALLEQHAPFTAPLSFEITLDKCLVPMLQAFGHQLSYQDKRDSKILPGAFFHATNPSRRKSRLPSALVAERRLAKNEVVRVIEVLQNGYVMTERLWRKARYSRRWKIPRTAHYVSYNSEAPVYEDEGIFYLIHPRYASAVDRFIALFIDHLEDRSADPTMYQPGPGKLPDSSQTN